MKFPIPLRAVLILVFGLATGANAGDDLPWKAAAASAVITPDEPVWMGGYAARRGPSEGVLEDIHAKVLALEDETGGRFAILTLDLIGVPRELRARVARDAAERLDLAPERLLVNASHTHCGPMVRVYRPLGGGDPHAVYGRIPEDEERQRVEQTLAYQQFVARTSGELLEKCFAELRPASLSWSHARCGFAMNRRTPTESGGWRNAPNPDAPVDHEVPVLQVRGADDELRAVLFGYACHATTQSIMQINGDWPGRAQSLFEEEHPGTVALFLNGASGDQNPYPRRFPAYLERHGRSMATAIEAALEARPRPVTSPIRAALDHCEIGYRLPSRREVERKAKSDDRYDARHGRFLLEAWEANGSLPTHYPVPVQVVRFGDSLTLVAMGGEVVVDYALRLKRELGEKAGGAPVWFAGYSNDVMGYIPSRRVLEEGGYEGEVAMRYVRSTLHPGPWQPHIEERLVGAVHELYDSLAVDDAP